jgi:hypothetical protein
MTFNKGWLSQNAFAYKLASIARCILPKGRYKKCLVSNKRWGSGFIAWSPTFIKNVFGDFDVYK